jgi:hypothetical protein
VVEIADAVLALEIVAERNLHAGMAICVVSALRHAGVGEHVARQSMAAGDWIPGAVVVQLVADALALIVVVADHVLFRAIGRGGIVKAVIVDAAIVASPVVAQERVIVAISRVLPFEATFACGRGQREEKYDGQQICNCPFHLPPPQRGGNTRLY